MFVMLCYVILMIQFYNIVFKTKYKICSLMVSTPPPQLKILGACQNWNKLSCCILSIHYVILLYPVNTLSFCFLSILSSGVSYHYIIELYLISTLSCLYPIIALSSLSYAYINLLNHINTSSCCILSIHQPAASYQYIQLSCCNMSIHHLAVSSEYLFAVSYQYLLLLYVFYGVIHRK
jgi:hypothetical protein